MKKMFFLTFCAAFCFACKKEASAEKEATPASATTAAAMTNPNMEFADTKYIEFGKKHLEALTNGNIDAMMEPYADNAKYYWNAGDSLVGKKAITDFWTKRRHDVIETITFKNEIWLPVKVTKAQSVEKTGIWLLSWYQVTAKYKGGKSMTQWIHMLYHFDANDKIDQVEQYVDKAPINAAMSK